MPVWLNHVLASLFLHQDAVFLHHQEKILAQRGYEAKGDAADDSAAYARLVHTPTAQDKMVNTFRGWLKKRGGGVPWPQGLTLPAREQDSRVLFDVWNTHTKHCKYCLAAHKNTLRVRALAVVAAGLSLALGNGLKAALGAAFSGLAMMTRDKRARPRLFFLI